MLHPVSASPHGAPASRLKGPDSLTREDGSPRLSQTKEADLELTRIEGLGAPNAFVREGEIIQDDHHAVRSDVSVPGWIALGLINVALYFCILHLIRKAGRGKREKTGAASSCRDKEGSDGVGLQLCVARGNTSQQASSPPVNDLERKPLGARTEAGTVELVGKRLGSGRLTVVDEGKYVCQDGTTHRVAVKRLSAGAIGFDDSPAEALRNELEVLQRLPPHPNIIGFHGGMVDSHKGNKCDGFLVEELMVWNLEQLIERSNEEQWGEPPGTGFTYSFWLHIFEGIVAGLQHLHAHGVIHYDLKPSNILLDEEFIVKLADFGCSSMELKSRITAKFMGTSPYMSPECLAGNLLEQEVPIDKVDVFSLGVIMWECITGQKPKDPLLFSTGSGHISIGIHSGTDSISTEVRPYQNWRFPLGDRRPFALRDLVWACVNPDISQRPKCNTIAVHLREFSSMDWAGQRAHRDAWPRVGQTVSARGMQALGGAPAPSSVGGLMGTGNSFRVLVV